MAAPPKPPSTPVDNDMLLKIIRFRSKQLGASGARPKTEQEIWKRCFASCLAADRHGCEAVVFVSVDSISDVVVLMLRSSTGPSLFWFSSEQTQRVLQSTRLCAYPFWSLVHMSISQFSWHSHSADLSCSSVQAVVSVLIFWRTRHQICSGRITRTSEFSESDSSCVSFDLKNI